jgi:predicted regulator of Ras-like GTPase activity (Roadblock/LC7/MglB family)
MSLLLKDMIMASEPRFARRKAVEPIAVYDDYDQDPKTSWAAKLDAFAPTAAEVKAAATAAAAAAAAPAASAESPVVALVPAPKTGRLEENLQELINFDGAVSVALVDSESGMILGSAGSTDDNLELAAAGASVMLRARRSTIKALGMGDSIDDLLVTLSTQLQIIRPLAQSPTLFLYLVVDRAKSSLAMARFKSSEAAGKIVL